MSGAEYEGGGGAGADEAGVDDAGGGGGGALLLVDGGRGGGGLLLSGVDAAYEDGATGFKEGAAVGVVPGCPG